MERSALGIVVIPVCTAADHHLALVGLAHIAVNGIGHHDDIHARFDRLRHKRLQRNRFNWQTEPGHVGQNARVTRDHNSELLGADPTFGGLNASDNPTLLFNARDLALLDDIHPHIRARTCVAPSDGVMPGSTAAGLPQPAQHRIARPVDVHDRADFLDLLRSNPFGLHTLDRVGMRGTLIAANFVLGLGQHKNATRREHDVVIQVLAQGLIQATRLFIDRR